ncbi:MAG: DMT family transporter [Caldisericia bacterium]|nr:DMT family transporter [Caldisericia bacterium]
MKELNPRIRIFANLLVLFSVTSWGLSFVSMKAILLAGIPPMTMTTIRYGIVACIISVVLIFLKRKKQLSWMDHLLLFFSGMSGVALYFWFEARGIGYTTASNASIIIALIPIVTALTTSILHRIHLRLWQILSIGISFLGAYFIVSAQGSSSAAPDPLKGNLLMLGAVGCWVLFTFLASHLHSRMDTLHATAWQSIYGFFLLLPFAILEKGYLVTVPRHLWSHFLFLSIVCSVLAFFFYNYTVKVIGVTVVSTYVNFIPVAGVVGGYFLLHETMSPLQWVGSLLIVLSLWTVNQGKKR